MYKSEKLALLYSISKTYVFSLIDTKCCLAYTHILFFGFMETLFSNFLLASLYILITEFVIIYLFRVMVSPGAHITYMYLLINCLICRLNSSKTTELIIFSSACASPSPNKEQDVIIL